MRLQKRYIYSGVLAALAFLVLYLIIDFSTIVSVALTVIIYIAGIFLFKEKDVREYNADDISHYYFLTSKLLSYKDRLSNPEIVEDIVELSDISTKILSALTQKPKKVTQVFNFYDYYMNLAISLLDKYILVVNKDTKTPKEEEYINKVIIYIENIKQQFKKQLDNMYKTSTIDVNKEIELFEKVCSIEGLDKEIGRCDDANS